MSYSLVGYFYNRKSKQFINLVRLDCLKNLNTRRYSNVFKDIESTSHLTKDDTKNLPSYVYTEYVNTYDKNILNEKDFSTHSTTDPQGRVVVDSVDELKKFNKYLISDLEIISQFSSNKHNTNIKYIPIYKREIENLCDSGGMWYTYNDFQHGLDKLKSELTSMKEEMRKLKGIKYTKDWFEMTDEARERYYDTIQYKQENIEEIEIDIESIQYVLNIFELFSHDLLKLDINDSICSNISESKVSEYVNCNDKYCDVDDIEVFICVW